MIRLGVNIDHVATLRQARRERFPAIVPAAHAALAGGADHITVHLREDRRHIQDADVRAIREHLDTQLELEIACTDEMVAFALDVKPDGVLFVPEKREELTTEGGLAVSEHSDKLEAAIGQLRDVGIPSTIFVDPDEEALLAANSVGANAVELHTGRYARARKEGARVREFLAIEKAARSARELGIRVHAGHGLDLRNVGRIATLREVEEMNIGFALVARAVFVGLENAVREMRDRIDRAREAGAAAT